MFTRIVEGKEYQMKYEVKMNGAHYCYFPELKYANNFVSAQRNKTKGGGNESAWAAVQSWTVHRIETKK